MSPKRVIYSGNLNIVQDSHRVHLLILRDDLDLYSITNTLLFLVSPITKTQRHNSTIELNEFRPIIQNY